MCSPQKDGNSSLFTVPVANLCDECMAYDFLNRTQRMISTTLSYRVVGFDSSDSLSLVIGVINQVLIFSFHIIQVQLNNFGICPVLLAPACCPGPGRNGAMSVY